MRTGQVHVARDKATGQKLAVKVQHRGLLEYVDGDIASVETAMRVTCALFPDFGQRFAWLVDEVLPVVKKELDFRVEARNCMMSRQQFSDDPQVIVPEVRTHACICWIELDWIVLYCIVLCSIVSAGMVDA
jgi:aarF domain-containing kinase